MQIIVLAGPNGAGKSTLAPFLFRDTLGLLEYVNADTIARGISAFNPENVAFAAGRIMVRRLHDLTKGRQDFAFETTLATRSYAPWLRQALQAGYSVHLIFVSLQSVELAVNRVRARVRAGGHNVPETVIRRRFRRGIENFFGLYEALADTWAVYDNSAADQAVVIARRARASELAIEDPDLWYSFRQAAR